MTVAVAVQTATAAPVPAAAALSRWVRAALAQVERADVEVTLRIVDEAESASLNRAYRGRARATNVLSFPFEAPPHTATAILGDVVLCAPLALREAAQLGRAPAEHWAHLVVHGILHLCGYDHRGDAEAATMEALESAILRRCGFTRL